MVNPPFLECPVVITSCQGANADLADDYTDFSHFESASSTAVAGGSTCAGTHRDVFEFKLTHDASAQSSRAIGTNARCVWLACTAASMESGAVLSHLAVIRCHGYVRMKR